MKQLDPDSTARTRTCLSTAESRPRLRIALLCAASSTIRLALLGRLLREEDGQDLIEYAFILALVGLGALASVSGLAGKLRTAFAAIGNAVTSAT